MPIKILFIVETNRGQSCFVVAYKLPKMKLIFEPFLKDEFTVWDYLIMVVYGLIVIISLFGNLLVFSVIIKTRRLHTITNLFIANLAFGDLLMTTFNIPFTVVR